MMSLNDFLVVGCKTFYLFILENCRSLVHTMVVLLIWQVRWKKMLQTENLWEIRRFELLLMTLLTRRHIRKSTIDFYPKSPFGL